MQQDIGGSEYSRGPDTEVWSHLYRGLDSARYEFEALGPRGRQILETFGRRIADARKTLVLSQSEGGWVELYDELLEDPWFRHAAEIHIATDGIERASNSLARFLKLRSVLTSYQLSEETGNYLREVIDTFLLGFDAASIVLCGATVEQVLRDLLIGKKLLTQQQIDRKPNPMSCSDLLKFAKEKNAISNDTFDAARCVNSKRNIFMHRHMGRHETLPELALESIKNLGVVLVALGNKGKVYGAPTTLSQEDHTVIENKVRERLAAGESTEKIAKDIKDHIRLEPIWQAIENEMHVSERLAAGESEEEIINDIMERITDIANKIRSDKNDTDT